MIFGKNTIQQSAMILLLTFITISSGAAPSWNGTTGTENGWPLVSNPGQPMQGDEIIIAEEVWRLGGDDDPQETVFGLIGDGLVDEQENTYLLDTILTTIYKVGPDGKVLANLGREGDGPGEFRNVESMVFLPDGDIGVSQMMAGGIVTIGRDGGPRPSFSYGEESGSIMQSISRMATDKNSVVIGQSSTDFGDNQTITSTTSLARYAPDGSLLNLLYQDKQEHSGGSISLGGDDNDFSRYWALGGEGRVVVFRENQEYKLEVFGADGEKEMLIRRDYEPVRRSRDEIERAQRQQEALHRRLSGLEFDPVPTMARHISDAFGRPNGELWVQNSQGDLDCPENAIGYFDVFNRDGRYVKRVRIAADYDPQRDEFRILGNHLLVFKEAQNAPERTASSGGAGMMMVMISGAAVDEEDDDEEPRPYEVIFYRLP